MDTGYPRIFEITPCEKHRQMHHDVRCADCEIDRLRKENERLRKAHESELGVCQTHCPEVERLMKVVKALVDWSNKYPLGRHYSYGHKEEIEGELERIEALAKQALGVVAKSKTV